MNVLGEKSDAYEVTLLVDNGTDLHSYQPTPEDILKISSCDIFVYVGGESDEWVEDALAQAVNPDLVAINLLDVLGDSAKEEEIVEGMEAEEEEEGEEEEGPEYDEHVWLSLKNASLFVDAITEAVCTKDETNKDIYESNAASYKENLSSLDKQYEETVAGAKRNTLLFADRFPFRYLTEDYGLNYYAAFIGCSAETEASFSTISFLCDKSDELELPVVMVIDGSDEEIAETIIFNSASKDKKVLTLDSMQSVALKDIKNGTTYLSVMEENLKVLKEALN
jgi:zinc transport system substrate-binding protein